MSRRRSERQRVASQVATAAAETKKSVGEIDLFTTIDHLVVRPSFWVGVALVCAWCYWRRWPAFFWRRVIKT